MNRETKIIKKYLKQIDASFVGVRCGKYETQADMEKNIIYFNPRDFQDKDFNKIIKDYYKTLGHKIKIHMGTYAILHELGHILSKMEIKNLHKRLDAYVKGQNNLPKRANDKVRFYKYRNLYIEKLADKYAYIVYKKFENETIKFDKELRKVAK